MKSIGLVLVVAGVVLAAVGALMMMGALSWFGKLPGDLRYESETTRVYVPIASMLLLSAALSLALYLVRRFFG